MRMMNNSIRLQSIEHRVRKGLVPKYSDVYFLYTLYMDLKKEHFLYTLYMDLKNEPTEEPPHNERTDGGTEKSVRRGRPRRSEEKRVRQGDSVWSESSNKKDNSMEGGEWWEVKAAVDLAHKK